MVRIQSVVKGMVSIGVMALSLAACADERLTPAPGEHPGWPQPSPPRASDSLPIPFMTQYASPSGTIQMSPPARPDGNVPFAVRGETPVIVQPKPAVAPLAADSERSGLK